MRFRAIVYPASATDGWELTLRFRPLGLMRKGFGKPLRTLAIEWRVGFRSGEIKLWL